MADESEDLLQCSLLFFRKDLFGVPEIVVASKPLFDTEGMDSAE